MKNILWQGLKVVFFTLVILSLQIAVVKEITDISFNLPLLAIISIASFASLELSLYSAAFFVISISLLSYNSGLYLSYILIAFITNQFNPKVLQDKFLVAAFYCIIFSPLLELIHNPISEGILDHYISTTVINLATLVPVYFILKIFFAKNSSIKTRVKQW